MEDYGSSFPSLCMDDVFHTFDGYDSGPYGRKKKKKRSLDVAECRLDSPCNSPEVIMSGGVEDGAKRCQTLLRGDSFKDEYDSAETGSTSDAVDMEGFCEIIASMTAGEDIMLSSSAKESMKTSKKGPPMHDLSNLTMEDVHDVSVSHNSSSTSSSSSSSALQSDFESDVDALLESSLSGNKVGLAEASHDLLPDLSAFTLSGYLLSDIPSHPDLFCGAPESVDPLLSYCSDSDERLKSAVSHIEHHNEDMLASIKCEENVRPKDPCTVVYSDFDALCTNILLSDMQSSLNDRTRTSICQCRGRDCLCYKSDASSAEEEDVCIEYILSQRPSKVRRARRSSRVVRRGPGRPRKIQSTDFIRRGPGRPRKKSVSDAVVWYQTRRKRTVSFSNGYKPRSRQKSLSDDKDAQNFAKRAHLPDYAADKTVKPKRSREGETGRPHWHAMNSEM